jgi:hypothetical protein
MVEIAALILAIVGPFFTAWFAYKAADRRSQSRFTHLETNDMVHLRARLDGIEERLGRIETWVFEHQRNHPQ